MKAHVNPRDVFICEFIRKSLWAYLSTKPCRYYLLEFYEVSEVNWSKYGVATTIIYMVGTVNY